MATRAPTKPFVVVFGGEDYLVDRERIRHRSLWPDRQLITLDGDGLADYELVEECRAGAFDESLRVVVLDNAHKVKGDKVLKSFIQTKGEKDISTILVAIVRSDKLTDVWALAGKKAVVIEYPKLKTYDDDNEVVGWIAFEAERVGIRLAPTVAERLFEFAGPDLGNIAGEIRKLEQVVGRGQQATLDHLRLVLAPTPTTEAWKVAEAVANKDFRRAMNLLSTFYKSEGERAHVQVVGALMKQIEKIMIGRYMLDANMTQEMMASALGVSKGRVFHMLPSFRKHTMPDLIKHMNRLCQLDAGVKGSSISKRTLVELAVISIAA
jgi:DNA polymerase III subunit delta